MEFFYSENLSDNQVFLGEEESHHCINVMRHKTGDQLVVTDGRGKKYAARIVSDDRRKCILEIEEVLISEERKNFSLLIAVAPTKDIHRFEWFLEKVTEIGMDEITPIICQRSERDQIKPERLQKILVSAMKQSLRLWLPKLNPMVPFKSFINSKISTPGSKFICHCQEQNLPLLKNNFQPKKSVSILIGPEGDFSMDEVRLAAQNGFIGVSLGEARLRTETAGIVACSTFNILNEQVEPKNYL